ncbi:hypothetical protein AX17_001397 [Amanita inopinata Kibby_2008]|nr:hypothetical protein AX17_001397 [Amanita inopinata Kibby_2008]
MTTTISPDEFITSFEEYDHVLSWINDALDVSDDADVASKTDLPSLEQRITQLMAALEIAYEDTSSQLERIIDDVSRAVPRLTYDLHFMKDAAVALQPNLKDLMQRSKEAVPENTSDVLDQIRLLDTVKSRMEAARDVLREAESWSTLEVEVTSLLTEQNYAKAAERLHEANKSMVVFQNTPEYDPRRTLLVNLQNQLEASLSSALVSAINAQEVTVCREYFSIFSTISRESEFRNYYYASRRNSIVAMWQAAKLSDCDVESTQNSQAIADFLPKFYATFLALLNQERISISAIFPDPTATLSTFITSTLSALQPTMLQRLASLSSHHGELALVLLIVAFQATEEFAVAVDKIMEKVRYTSRPSIDNAGKTETSLRHVRRRSNRMSISWRSRPTPGADPSLPTTMMELEWDQVLFQPFVEFQVEYGSLERRFLDHALRELASNASKEQGQNIDHARLFREGAVDIFGIADGSLNRCSAFTYGYGSVGLVQALDGIFESFIGSWTSSVQTGVIVSTTLAQSFASQEDLSDLDYTAQDWLAVQTLVRLLAVGHAFDERLLQFETRLRTRLAEYANRFRLARDDPSNFIVAATRGQSQSLEQLALNSVELHDLLDSVEASSLQGLSSRQTAPISQPSRILIQARQAVSDFARSCQTSLQQTILSPLKRYLKAYMSLSIWTSSDEQSSNRMQSLRIPTFSLSPSDTVQRVAEGLLNLPRLFEVYADDDALSFSLGSLPFVDSDTIKLISEQTEVAATPPMHRRRSSVTSVKQQTIDPEIVSSTWLLSLGKGLLYHITTDVLPQLPALSAGGVAQLASDLEYLSNIVRALNVENEGLEKWRRGLVMDEEEGRKLFKQGSGHSVLQHIARLRGWDK